MGILDTEFHTQKEQGRLRFDRKCGKKQQDMGWWARGFKAHSFNPHTQWKVEFKSQCGDSIVKEAEEQVITNCKVKKSGRKATDVETVVYGPHLKKQRTQTDLVPQKLSAQMQRGLHQHQHQRSGKNHKNRSTKSRNHITQALSEFKFEKPNKTAFRPQNNIPITHQYTQTIPQVPTPVAPVEEEFVFVANQDFETRSMELEDVLSRHFMTWEEDFQDCIIILDICGENFLHELQEDDFHDCVILDICGDAFQEFFDFEVHEMLSSGSEEDAGVIEDDLPDGWEILLD